MTNLSNFKTTLDFENHVLKKIIGRDFPIYGTGDQERGQARPRFRGSRQRVVGNLAGFGASN